MYQKYLTLLLFTLVSGNIINYALQNLNINHLLSAEDNSQAPVGDTKTVEEKTNEPPKADDQKISVDENDNVKITLEGKDNDNGDQVKFEIVAEPSHGKLDNFDKSDGTVTYIPDKDYAGDDDFKYKVIDEKGADSDKATVDITVKTVNQAPKADDQMISANANDNVKITLEGKDNDKGDQVKFEIVADPSHGKLDNFDKSGGIITYTPDGEYSGKDDFKFKVIDEMGADSNTAEVVINVKSTDQPSQGVSNEPSQGVSNEPSQGVSNEPSQGVSNEPSGEVSQAVENRTAIASLRNDQVDATNKPPVAYDQDLSVDANDKIDISLVGDDVDKDPVQFAIVSNPSDASLNSFDMTKGTVTYIPQRDYVGNDSFAFKVIDDKGAESNIAAVSVDVKASATDIGINDSANHVPTAIEQNTSVDKNNQLNITLIGHDVDKDPVQFAIVSNPSDASLNSFDMAKGTVTYIPQRDYVGNDSFAFKVIDDKGAESNIAAVSVDVKENNQTNQAPQAFDLSTNESNLSNYRYLTWSAGEEEDRYILFARSEDGGSTFSSPVSLSGSSRSAVFNPELSSSGNNVYVVWQGPSKNGNQDIFLRKSSDYGTTFGGIENISNDPGGSGNPEVTVVGNSTHVTWEGTTPGNNFIFYTKSDDGSAFDSPQKLSSNLGVSYNPQFIENDKLGTDSFKYKVTDDKGAQSNVATVDVNTDAIARSSLEKDVKIASLNKNDEVDIKLKAYDRDNDSLKYEIVTTPSEGSLYNFDSNSGTVTYVPNENNGIDISWHNYMNGHDKTMTKNVDAGSSSVKLEKNDPFKAQR
jgi:hypothetical protein